MSRSPPRDSRGLARQQPGTRQFNLALARMATLQIDSVNVFARSHYMPLFSRLGPYDTAALDRLLFARKAPYVEYWAHMASFIPASDWGLFGFRMQANRAKYGDEGRAAGTSANREIVDWVRAELADRGPLRPAEIEHDAKTGARGPVVGLGRRQERARVPVDVRRGGDRRAPGVRATVRARRGRDPRRRDGRPSPARMRSASSSDVPRPRTAWRRHPISRTTGASRIGPRSWRRSAIWRMPESSRPSRSTAGRRRAGPSKAWLHRDAALPRRVDAAALLTPFDPVVWFRDRAERLFGFEYRIEIYTPAPEAPLRLLLAAAARRRRHRGSRRPQGRPCRVDPARPVGVVGARPAGRRAGTRGRRAARRRAVAGARERSRSLAGVTPIDDLADVLTEAAPARGGRRRARRARRG